jgi:small multidrug resistance pump
LLLVGAICAEVMATLSLRVSDGFSKLGLTVLVAVGYIVAFTLLSFGLERGLNLGIAYSI